MAGFSSTVRPARPVTRPAAPQPVRNLPTPNQHWTSTPGPPQPGFVQATPTAHAGAQTNNPFTGPGAPPAGAPLTTTVTHTVTPPPPDLSGNNWLAYLSPDQLNSLNQAGYQWAQGVGDQNANIGNAQNQYNVQNANAQYAHDVNTAQANEALAARGLFSSGIRANDLTDINRTLADTQAAATATLNTLVGEAQRAIIGLNNSWGSTQAAYQGIAAGAAAASPAAQPYQVTEQVPMAAPAQAPPPAAAAGPTPQQIAAWNEQVARNNAAQEQARQQAAGAQQRAHQQAARNSQRFSSSAPRRVR
jgi:hypothetical protein